MFLMDITQSDDADRLLRDLDMLKDDALEEADAAVRCPTLDSGGRYHPSYHRRDRSMDT